MQPARNFHRKRAMCAETKSTINPNLFFVVAFLLGVCSGYWQHPFVLQIAEALSQIFINLLKLVSLPLIFLSIVSTASGMENIGQIRRLGGKVLKYTLLTTLIAASVALALFIVLDPVSGMTKSLPNTVTTTPAIQADYFSFFMQIIPSNIVQPFSENNVIGVLFLAMLLSLSIVTLPIQHRTSLHTFFSAIYAAIITVTRWIIRVMPIAI